MNRFENVTKPLMWFMALLLIAFVAGCGGGSQDPILGGGGAPTPSPTPIVTYTIPINHTPGVLINRSISAHFSIPMNPATICGPAGLTAACPVATFTVTCGVTPGCVTPAGVVTYDAVSQIALFNPDADLAINTQYIGTITTAATSVAGAAIASNYIWDFTTSNQTDFTNPLLLSTDPADDPTNTPNVPVNQIITATFNEPMDQTKICGPAGLTVACPAPTFTVTCVLPCTTPTGLVTTTATTASFAPDNPLEAGATYTATIAASDLAGNAWLAGNVPNPWTFTISNPPVPHLGPAPVILGATQPYGVLSNTGVTLGGGGVTGNRVTGVGAGTGDVGIFPAGACVGCTVGPLQAINGLLENGTVPAQDAMVALQVAYDDAIGRALNKCTLVAGGDMSINPPPVCGGASNGTYAPGLYWSGTSISIPAGSTITLDGQGDPTAVFIFQSESSIGSLANTHVNLIGLAQAKNVFWVGKSQATIGGVGADFAGTLLMLTAATVNTGTTMVGRALARGAAVTVQDGAVIQVPAP